MNPANIDPANLRDELGAADYGDDVGGDALHGRILRYSQLIRNLNLAINALAHFAQFSMIPAMETDRPDDIAWIKAGLEKPGKTQKGLADHLGVDPAQISRLLGGTRSLKHREVEKIAEYLEVNPPPSGHFSQFMKRFKDVGSGNHPLANATPGPTGSLLSDKEIPVYASAEGGTFGMTISYDPIERIPCPAPLVGVKGAFGFYIVGDSMEPRYFHGDIVCVHPTKPVKRGNFVLVVLKNESEMTHDALVKRLVSMNSTEVVLEQLNPPRKLDPIARSKIHGIHLVVASFDGSA